MSIDWELAIQKTACLQVALLNRIGDEKRDSRGSDSELALYDRGLVRNPAEFAKGFGFWVYFEGSTFQFASDLRVRVGFGMLEQAFRRSLLEIGKSSDAFGPVVRLRGVWSFGSRDSDLELFALTSGTVDTLCSPFRSVEQVVERISDCSVKC